MLWAALLGTHSDVPRRRIGSFEADASQGSKSRGHEQVGMLARVGDSCLGLSTPDAVEAAPSNEAHTNRTYFGAWPAK